MSNFEKLKNTAKLSTVICILIGFALKYASQTPIVLFAIHAALTLGNSLFLAYVVFTGFKYRKELKPADNLGLVLYLVVSLGFAYQSYGFYLAGGTQ